MSRDTLATSTSVTYYFNRQVWKRLFKKVGETCWPNITKYEKGCCVLVLPWQIVLQGDLQTVNPDHLDFQSNFPRGIQHCPIKKMKDLVHKWRHKYVDIFCWPSPSCRSTKYSWSCFMWSRWNHWKHFYYINRLITLTNKFY